jgi:type IV secretory pathway VirD2 relaxase
MSAPLDSLEMLADPEASALADMIGSVGTRYIEGRLQTAQNWSVQVVVLLKMPHHHLVYICHISYMVQHVHIKSKSEESEQCN